MLGAEAGFFSGPDFTQAGNKALELRCIFKINLLDIFFTEETLCHIRFAKLKVKNEKVKNTT
jgi:hypothetical protein